MARVSEAKNDATLLQPPPLRLSRVFHAPHSLRHCRGREANALPKLAKREARILLKFVENLPPGLIEQPFDF